MTDHILYEQDGPLAFLTFNRPQARNAMTWEMYQALVERCDTVEGDSSIQVLILRGAGGKAFVSGTDIAQFRNFESPNAGIDYEKRLDAVIDRLEAVSKPTIAQIDGVTTGGGCALAALQRRVSAFRSPEPLVTVCRLQTIYVSSIWSVRQT